MGKHETLPFKMTVERGKLIPATPYDAERLDTWRNGTAVNVTFIRDGGRVMERKWWAILNRAVKECKTPWKTAAEASEAIKLAIGVVNLTKTVGGEFMAYPKSLTELDDPDLDEAVQQMIDVVHHVTGVDPEEWKKQVAHIRDDQSSDTPSPSDEGSGEAAPSPSPAADLSPADESGKGEGDNTGSVTTEQAAPSSESIPAIKHMLMEECIENMLRDALSDKAESKVEKLRDVFLEPQNLGDFPDFVNRCADTALRVVGKPAERDRAKEYLTGRIPA